MRKRRYKPYVYQEECLKKIAEAREAGEVRALVVMASSLGKTLTSAFEVERFFAGQRFGRVLILCHSEEILEQTKEKFKSYFGEEKSYGMFTSSHKTTDVTNFLFATFQTMKIHRKEFQRDAFDYIIVDEAHHSCAVTYFPTIRYFKPKFLLGLTATPDRLDGQDIAEIYGEPVYELGFVEANNRELMTKCEYRMLLDDLLKDELELCVSSEEKLSIAQLNRTLFAPRRDEEIVRIIQREMASLDDPKTMIFCRSIKHAQKIARLLGDDTALVHNGQGSTANTLALNAFREGKLRTVVSVQMLNEGVDVPDANMVVFLRNTVSPTIFYQQLGRGTRLAEGKEKTVVLDFVANCERVKMILELQKEIEGFRTQKPRDEPVTSKPGEEKPNFTLDIATPEFEARMVDIVELIERASRGREWTKEEIILALQKLAEELGRTPRASDLDNRSDMPGRGTTIRYFGSFNNALIAAGLDVWKPGLSKEKAIELVMTKSVNGIMPPRVVFDNDPMMPWGRAIIRALEVDTWADCAEVVGLIVADATGLKLNEKQREELMLRHLGFYYDESIIAGHWLTVAEINANPKLKSHAFYSSYFGSMFNIRNKAFMLFCSSKEEEAILTRNGKTVTYNRPRRTSTGISKQYIVDGVVRLTKELRRKPVIADIEACDYLPTYSSVRTGVGGLTKLSEVCRLDEVLESMGLNTETEPKRCKPRKNREEMTVFVAYTDGSFELKDDQKRKMQEFVRRNGRRIKKRDLCRKNGLPSDSIFRHYHLSMGDVNRMIGVDEILAELAKEQEQKQKATD